MSIRPLDRRRRRLPALRRVPGAREPRTVQAFAHGSVHAIETDHERVRLRQRLEAGSAIGDERSRHEWTGAGETDIVVITGLGVPAGLADGGAVLALEIQQAPAVATDDAI